MSKTVYIALDGINDIIEQNPIKIKGTIDALFNSLENWLTQSIKENCVLGLDNDFQIVREVNTAKDDPMTGQVSPTTAVKAEVEEETHIPEYPEPTQVLRKPRNSAENEELLNILNKMKVKELMDELAKRNNKKRGRRCELIDTLYNLIIHEEDPQPFHAPPVQVEEAPKSPINTSKTEEKKIEEKVPIKVIPPPTVNPIPSSSSHIPSGSQTPLSYTIPKPISHTNLQPPSTQESSHSPKPKSNEHEAPILPPPVEPSHEIQPTPDEPIIPAPPLSIEPNQEIKPKETKPEHLPVNINNAPAIELPAPTDKTPIWIQDVYLNQLLDRQFGDGGIDPDSIFGHVMTCNLAEVFPQSTHIHDFSKRDSSGIWQVDEHENN